MQANLPEKKDATIGYFTTVVGEQTGWTGGLLILDRAGRPLEFQCTLPVRPTRAHEILYGPTLRRHLVSEVIGKVLLAKARTPISLLCVDHHDSFEIESFTDAVVALVTSGETNEADADRLSGRPVAEANAFSGMEILTVAGASFSVAMERREEAMTLAPFYDDLPDAVEPFERIREAIKEAQSQLSRQAPEAA